MVRKETRGLTAHPPTGAAATSSPSPSTREQRCSKSDRPRVSTAGPSAGGVPARGDVAHTWSEGWWHLESREPRAESREPRVGRARARGRGTHMQSWMPCAGEDFGTLGALSFFQCRSRLTAYAAWEDGAGPGVQRMLRCGCEPWTLAALRSRSNLASISL